MEHVLLSVPCAGTPTFHRVGRAGHGRHGGEASALCDGSDDVGLEFLVLLFQDKRTRKPHSQKPAIARASVDMTRLLRHGRKRKTIYPLVGSRKSCNFAAQIPVRGCVPNFGEVTDYMTGRTSDHGRSKRKRGTVKLGQVLF